MPTLLSPSPLQRSTSSRFNVQCLPRAIAFLAVTSPLRNKSCCLFPSLKKLTSKQNPYCSTCCLKDSQRQSLTKLWFQLSRIVLGEVLHNSKYNCAGCEDPLFRVWADDHIKSREATDCQLVPRPGCDLFRRSSCKMYCMQ